MLLAFSIYTLTALFLLYEMALQVSPSVITHDLMRALDTHAVGIGLLASIYFYSYTAMQIPAGLLFDRFKLRTLITINVGLCAIGALLFGLAEHLGTASMGRLLMGIGSAFAFIGVLTAAAQWFDKRWFALLVGVAQLLAAIGAIVGEVPLAALVNAFTWRPTLIGFACFGFLLAFVCWLVIRERPQPLQQATSPASLSVGASLLKLIKQPQTWFIGLYAFSSWGPIAIVAGQWGIPFLEVAYDLSSLQAASAIALVWLGVGIASPIVGWLSDKLQRRCPLLLLTSLIGLISSLGLLFYADAPIGVILFCLAGIGIGGSGQILTFAMVKEMNTPTVTSTAIGFNNMAVVAGGLLLYVAGYLLDYHWTGSMNGNIPFYGVAEYRNALLLVPACFVLGVIMSVLFIKDTLSSSRIGTAGKTVPQ